jgi:ribose 5-phosphate isomerase B
MELVMNLIIACDHGGLAIKNAVKTFVETRGYHIQDLGTH